MRRASRGERPGVSLLLAVVVHLAAGGIVVGLAWLPEGPRDEAPHVVVSAWDRHWPLAPQRPTGSGSRRPEQAAKRATAGAAAAPVAAAQGPASSAWAEERPGFAEAGVEGTTWAGEGDPDGSEPSAEGDSGAGTQGEPATPAGEEPLVLRGDMIPPKLLLRVEPEYPALAARLQRGGTVVLRCVIGADGGVSVREVLRAEPLLTEAAIAAVEKWRYEPARWNGRPQAVFQTIRLEFR